MRLKFMLCFIGLAGVGCTDEGTQIPAPGPGEPQTVVYESGPHLAQCAPPALTPAQSAAKLTSAGIQVHRSSCGHQVGIAHPAVCGGGTSEIILHDIPAPQLEDARAAGFGSVDDLGDWQRGDCAAYIHAIEVAQGTTSCADIRNRVLQIVEPTQSYRRVVLLDQAGNCADASYRQVLYGEDGKKVLCSNAESIAGPQMSCPVASYAAMFETILANLAAPDLGLGSSYEINQVYPGM